MRVLIKFKIILVSFLLISCNSIASFNFRILEEGTPVTYDPGNPNADAFGYVPAVPGYDVDFDFTINGIEIVENVVSIYWVHHLVINFEVKNKKSERSVLPDIGIVLVNEEESHFEPSYFEYPYISGTFNPKLNYFQETNDESSFLPLGSLGANQNLKFKSTTLLSQNSNIKLEGKYYLHFLRVPASDATHKDSETNPIQFIKENSIFNISLNMSSIYSF